MWKNLEQKVRDIASFRWSCNSVAETIAGVKCDCVLKPQKDHWIIVEITEENSLHKVREDIAKLFNVRNYLFTQNIYGQCYFVTKFKPTDSMRNTGDAQNVAVMSVDEFQNEYFDYGKYIFIRTQKPFGSLINIETGEPESNTYVDVSYQNVRTGEELRISDIINLLKKGKKVILKGDFGLGKSRCVKKIFEDLTTISAHETYTIAINLRDHWGAKRAVEILSRHLTDLGLDEKNFIKNYESPNTIYLLDGFDEIGTQSWSSDTRKMQHMRELSVCALKDLIGKVKGGVLITGREYYFNSDKEMLNCLGLGSDNTVILECHSELTDSELLSFISENLPESIEENKLDALPIWLPKRPLVIQLLLKYASDILSLKYALDDICGFWHAFLSKICEREAKIYPALNPEIIKGVLLHLADHTRFCPNDTGPISQNDLANAFTTVAGFSPNDESSIMLQRLPSLGRISADSPDRQFLDSFILNGLRSESIIQLSGSWNQAILSSEWKNPLNLTGISILSEYISKDEKRIDTFLSMAKTASFSKNRVLASDIIAALCLLDIASLDFKDLYISDGHFSYLSFEEKEISRLSISQSIIERADLTNCQLSNSVIFNECIISTVYGIASQKSVPEQFLNCEIDCFETLATTTLIKKARLSESQKLFVQMLRKIFFQPGAGRKEAALLRGMGMAANKPLGEKILSKLI